MGNIFAEIGKAFIIGAAEAANDLNKRQAERELAEARRRKEQHINITIGQPAPTETVYVHTETVHTTRTTNENGVTFVYSLEELKNMRYEELRDELRQIGNDNTASREIREEAKLIRNSVSSWNENTRDRAKMIKFLYEKGQI